MALLRHSVSEKGFPDSQMEPPVFCALCLWSCHWIPLERAWLCLLFSLVQVFIHMDEIHPEPSLAQNDQSSQVLPPPAMSVNVQLVNLTCCFFTLCPVPSEMGLGDYNIGLYCIDFFSS